jgi:16S rRNA (adenine1518-N6/adenine1519-N6)-dimethyltransferase
MSAHKQVNAVRRSRSPARKAKLGQNFLVDATAARRIVEALGDISHSVVIEIGPGGGALTKMIADHAQHLTAIELDEALAQRLQVAFNERENVKIVQANFLDVSLPDLLKGHCTTPTPAKVVGNIPYYITSDILLRLFEQHELLETVVVMVQKEVADRLVAEPGSRDYGLLTVTASLFADVERLFTLAPSAFAPPPRVYSSVLRLRIAPKAGKLGVDAQEFLNFCKLAFAQKRKTLFNNLRGHYGEAEIKAALRGTDLREDVRAEGVELDKLAEIYNHWRRRPRL